MTTKADYILTASGREVSVANEVVPSLGDIAQSLSRIPRFAGHGKLPWSVLDHTLFCYALSKQGAMPYAFPALGLAMLLHDAHEAVTGDIPTPVKTADMKSTQWALDLKIMDAYFPGGYDAYDFQHAQVKKVDLQALLVEALLVGPRAITSASDVLFHFGGLPRQADIETWNAPEYRPGEDIAEVWLDLVALEYGRIVSTLGPT